MFFNIVALLKKRIQKLVQTGFFPIVITSFLVKVVAFVGGAVLVRVLTKSDYGLYSYVSNSRNMLMLIGDMGCSVAAMQFCNEAHNNPKKRNAYYLLGFWSALGFSLLGSIFMLTSPLFYPYQLEHAAEYVMMLCFLPILVGIYNMLQINLRVQLRNRRYSVLGAVYAAVHYAVILPTAFFFGVKGALLSEYITYFAAIIVALLLNKRLIDWRGGTTLITKPERSQFYKFAFASQANNTLDFFLMQMDIFCIGLFFPVQDIIASYKVATVIPTALLFIPNAIMTYAGPYFVRKNQDKAWICTQYNRLIGYSALLHGIIAVGLIIFAPWILPFIFGAQYADAVLCFRILIIGYFFSATIRVPSSNVIYTQRKLRVNLALTIVAGVVKIVLDIFLIQWWASVGAAITTMLVNILVSVISLIYMKYIYLKKEEA